MVKIVSSLAQAECMFFSKNPCAGFMSPAAFVCGICSRYRFNRVGRNRRRGLLAQVSTQPESLTPIDFRTSAAWENPPVEAFQTVQCYAISSALHWRMTKKPVREGFEPSFYHMPLAQRIYL